MRLNLANCKKSQYEKLHSIDDPFSSTKSLQEKTQKKGRGETVKIKTPNVMVGFDRILIHTTETHVHSCMNTHACTRTCTRRNCGNVDADWIFEEPMIPSFEYTTDQ